jgi:hypothetical protein
LPYYAGGTVYTTSFATDALDRVVLTTLPDSATRSTAYAAVATGAGYDSVTVTDELARPTKTVRDAYGRTAPPPPIPTSAPGASAMTMPGG